MASRLPGMVLAVVLVEIVAGCGATLDSPQPNRSPDRSSSQRPTGVPTTGAPTASAGPTVPAPVRPGEGRLVWLVDATGSPGIWTTDLAGGDVRTFVSGVAEQGGSIHDAARIGNAIVFLRDGIATTDLWTVREGVPPVRLLDGVASFLVAGEAEIVVARDVASHREIVRVPLDGSRTTPLGELPVLPPDDTSSGPFGLAVSPDGRTVAAGWVGGPVEVLGPVRSALLDIGAPLVVDDDGRLVATTGRAGEAYLLRGDELRELAPADSDPLVAIGSGIVAWGFVGDDGSLRAVEVRDVLSGAARSYRASGVATNVHEVTANHVQLEATAFDPLRRTVGFLDLGDGRFGTFETSAPASGS